MELRSKWSNDSGTCVSPNNGDDGVSGVAVATVNDISQLVIMLIGLLRLHRKRRGLIGYLYVQVGVLCCAPLLALTMFEIGLGLGVACRRDDRRDSDHGRFWFFVCRLQDKLCLTFLTRSS